MRALQSIACSFCPKWIRTLPVALGGVEQAVDEPFPADAVQRLVGMDTVGLQCHCAPAVVNHASTHRRHQLADSVFHAGLPQGVAAALTQ